MASVRISDQVRPGVSDNTIVLPDMPERASIRELIRTRVREEVARANADRSQPHRLLVTPLEAEQTVNGYRVRDGWLIDWERQADVAVEAFQRQAFFVFVDGKQVDDLDDEVPLGVDTQVRFLRLVPLVGG